VLASGAFVDEFIMDWLPVSERDFSPSDVGMADRPVAPSFAEEQRLLTKVSFIGSTERSADDRTVVSMQEAFIGCMPREDDDV
jgi:hypothetical protein